MSATINSSIRPEQNPCGELNDPGASPIFPNLENKDILLGGSVNCSGGGDGERSEGEFGEEDPEGRGRKWAEPPVPPPPPAEMYEGGRETALQNSSSDE